MKKYYPSSESILGNRVKSKDFYDYLYHGFIIVRTDEGSYYCSCCLTKPFLYIPKTEEVDEIFRQKDVNKSNINNLILLFSRLRRIQIRYGNDHDLTERIKRELAKEEFKNTVNNFIETIRSIIKIMFPDYQLE